MDRHPPVDTEDVDAFGGNLLAFMASLGSVAALAGLALIAAAGPRAPAAVMSEPAAYQEGWTTIAHPRPAFSLSIPALGNASYSVERHEEGGGRKDLMTFGQADGLHPYASVEVYQPGTELESFADPFEEAMEGAAVLGRPVRASAVRAIDSEFGPIAALDFTVAGLESSLRCLGFARNFAAPRVRLSGVYCHPGVEPVSRRIVRCAIERLSVARTDDAAAVSQLFARAARKRTFCIGQEVASAPSGGAGWLDALAGPKLRGALAEFRN